MANAHADTPTTTAFDALGRAIVVKLHNLVGSPATIKRYVERYTEETGANYFCASFQWGDLTHAEASKSLRLFSEHVMPAFATA